ncbi:MAG: hypothetical protein OER86_13815 [Phycisphaerae bacterium]|nr:hypothetical protein [Phycisphaerae bacterium]
MAKNRNTFVKRQREMDKKRKAAEKLEKKRRLKEEGGAPTGPIVVDPYAPDPPDDAASDLDVSSPENAEQP